MSAALLTEQMLPHVDEAQLDYNAAQQLQEYATDDTRDNAYADAIQEHLLTVPLVHYVRSAESGRRIAQEGLKVLAELPANTDCRSYPLDKSLGLDQYSFSSVAASPSALYGYVGIYLDIAKVIDRSIVTATDINSLTAGHGGGNLPYDNLDHQSQQNIAQEYFGSMVRGSDWLRMSSWRVLRFLKENGLEQPIPLVTGLDFGEMKHHGSIPPDAITGICDATDKQTRLQTIGIAEDETIRKGFLPSDLATILYMCKPELHGPVIKRMQAGKDVWRRVLGVTALK